MQPVNIEWSSTPPPHDCVYENEGGLPIHIVKQNGEDGCSKCLLVYLSSHLYGRSRFEGVLECTDATDGLVIAYEKSPLGFMQELGAVQLFFPAGTPRPAWNLIRPGRTSSKGRREQFQWLLSTWIKECDATHKRCTNNDSILPRRVLDVGDSRHKHLALYASSQQYAPYVALSHCWGKNPVLRTTKANVKDHEKAIIFRSLPKNFQDAVTICRGIGIRYLWIDSLCIIQDDKSDWETQSAEMATIYNNAYLVLAASQAANATNGFLDRKDEGFSETPQLDAKKSLKIAKLRNPNGTISHIYCRKRNNEPLHQHRFKVEEAPLNRRGWVLQENTLSRRIVHFTNSEVLWECIECLKCECMEIEDEDLEENSRITAGMVRNAQFTRTKAYGAPEDLHKRWLYLISRYKGLVLTHDADRLPALSGLARLWQSRGAGQYLAGIWRDHLPESLLWYNEERTSCKRWDGYMAPSWSPFSLGYIDDRTNIRRPAFEFLDLDYHIMTERVAQVVDAQSSPVGNDTMGAVKAGFIELKSRMGTIRVEGNGRFHSVDSLLEPYQGPSKLHPGIWGTVRWDCPAGDVYQRDVSLILLAYSNLNSYVHYVIAMVVMPSETVPGAYKRVGLLRSPRGDLRKFLESAEERVVKIV
ncbi:hypothetical protein NW768_012184 [Fusarium equiseti]|uniref:Heterokaryon incompatibility domain-containing protein n=1 Tax=Fusarium equiseti TaxID=61235 RepID=A0ABQ8QW02_FUSEQ|nr:hypothetical protein NW768_012184 [Fusarium equiseti]